MLQVFGATWKEYGTKPNQVWTQKLSELTKAELERGKNTVFELALDFPPNLAQFLKYCKQGKPHDKVNDVVRPNYIQCSCPD